MCFKELGLSTIRRYNVVRPANWKHFRHEPTFKVKKSSISNAGKGVFLSSNANPLNGSDFVTFYQGEPIETWQYEAIDHGDNLTGIKIKLPKIGAIVWHGIEKTLGCCINSSLRDRDANVEFVINSSRINHKQKSIDCSRLIEVRVKPNHQIMPGEELFLFYGPDFWKHFKTRYDPFCVVCIEFSGKFLFCCKCGLGFHLKCLAKKNERITNKKWLCIHCKEL